MDTGNREIPGPSRSEFESLESIIGSLKPVEQDYACKECDDSGYIYDFESHRVIGECKCMVKKNTDSFNQWKLDQIAELAKRAGVKINLAETRPHVLMGQELPKAVWLWGAAGSGKSHLAAWAVREKLRKAPLKIKWSWRTIRPILAAWSGQYSPEPDVRIEAMQLIRELRDCSILALDDVDKIGTITPAREEAFFDMIDDMYIRGGSLIITSQIPIREFCLRMPHEAEYIKRDGVGPQTRRLLEICKEIEVLRQ